MNIGLHCRIIGKPGRFLSLKKFVDYAQSFSDVWFTTRIEIARHGEGVAMGNEDKLIISKKVNLASPKAGAEIIDVSDDFAKCDRMLNDTTQFS